MADAVRSESEAALLLERVRAAVPLLAAEAAESERLRRPTDAAIRTLEETGVFRLMVPRRYGGLELDLDAFLDVGLALAAADVSLAWIACFYIEHNWMLCQFPESFQGALFAERTHRLVPAAIAPAGRAHSEAGGFRLSGRWQWGTGVMHADWVIVGATADPDSEPTFRFFALPISDVTIDDTWYVDGMCGTGSNDIVIDDAFVPDDRSVPIAELVAGTGLGARLHAGPLYGTPMIPILLLAASMPIVGQARAVADGFREHLADHVRMGSPGKQSEKPAVQMRLARAEIEARQAELVLRDVAREVQAFRASASQTQRARWASQVAHAVHQSRRVVQDVAAASGARAHFQHHALQRALRDVNVASCHVVFDLDAQLELYGRLLLGLAPSAALF